MDYKTAAKEIQKGVVKPIYVCYGTEKYRIREFIHFLSSHVIGQENRDLALTKFDLNETPIEAVVEEAETLPFLVPRKVILVSDSTVFAAGKDSNKIDHKTDRLLKYMDNPADYSVIVFFVQNEKLDERKKTVKKAKECGAVISFAPLGAEELLQWIKKQARERRCDLAAGAAEALVASAGTNLQTLASEIEKLCLYAGDGGVIEPETVEQLVARSSEQNIFVLIEQIAQLKLEKALGIYYDLLKQREEPIKIVALIARQFRIMLQVKELARQSYSQQQMASTLGLHPYAVKLAAEQAKKFDAGRLSRILADLAQLDYEMKSGRVDKILGIELFLLRLAA